MVSTWTTKKPSKEVTEPTQENVSDIITEIERNWRIKSMIDSIPEEISYIARVPGSNHLRQVNPRRTEKDPAQWSYGVLYRLRKLSRCSRGDFEGAMDDLKFVVEAMEKGSDYGTGLLGLWPRNLRLAVVRYKVNHPRMVANWALVRAEKIRRLNTITGSKFPIPCSTTVSQADSDSETDHEDDEDNDDDGDDGDNEDSLNGTTLSCLIAANVRPAALGQPSNRNAATDIAVQTSTVARDVSPLFVPEASIKPEQDTEVTIKTEPTTPQLEVLRKRKRERSADDEDHSGDSEDEYWRLELEEKRIALKLARRRRARRPGACVENPCVVD